jgi:hypothetical protein
MVDRGPEGQLPSVEHSEHINHWKSAVLLLSYTERLIAGMFDATFSTGSGWRRVLSTAHV